MVRGRRAAPGTKSDAPPRPAPRAEAAEKTGAGGDLIAVRVRCRGASIPAAWPGSIFPVAAEAGGTARRVWQAGLAGSSMFAVLWSAGAGNRAGSGTGRPGRPENRGPRLGRSRGRAHFPPIPSLNRQSSAGNAAQDQGPDAPDADKFSCSVPGRPDGVGTRTPPFRFRRLRFCKPMPMLCTSVTGCNRDDSRSRAFGSRVSGRARRT